MAAEEIAADHLAGLGYEIIERNFNCKLGEIDIIARHMGDLVFIEVKARHSTAAFNPVFAVNRRKQDKIIRAARLYLKRRYRENPTARFDVVVVTMEPEPHFEVIPNAFDVPHSFDY